MIVFMAFSLRTNFPSTNRIIVVYACSDVIARSPLTEQDSSSSSGIHEFLQPSTPLKVHHKNLSPRSLISSLNIIIEDADITSLTHGDDASHQENHEHEVIK